MQIRLIVRDENGRELGRFPEGQWEPHGPDGISFGPGGTIVQAIEIPSPGRYLFTVEGLTATRDPEATDIPGFPA